MDLKSLALAGGVAFGGALICDRGLGLLHLSSGFAHPPRLSERRDNLEFNVRFETNSQGLRYREVPLDAPSQGRRTLVLGDSFVEGHGVEAEQTFSALLERNLSRFGGRVEFVNGGLSGTGPKQYRDLFLEVGLRYHPDSVLLCVYANDLVDTPHASWGGDVVRAAARAVLPNAYSRLRAILAARGRESESQPFRDRIQTEARRMGLPQGVVESWMRRLPKTIVAAAEAGRFNASILAYSLFRPDYWIESLDMVGPRVEGRWLAMTGHLEKIVVECRRRGIEIEMVFIPSQFQYDLTSHRPGNPWVAAGARIERRWLGGDCELVIRLKAWSDLHGVAFLDLTQAMRQAAATGAQIDFPLDGHWTPEGHAAAAVALAVWLNDGRRLRLPPSEK